VSESNETLPNRYRIGFTLIYSVTAEVTGEEKDLDFQQLLRDLECEIRATDKSAANVTIEQVELNDYCEPTLLTYDYYDEER
jgi:hypothetical protein